MVASRIVTAAGAVVLAALIVTAPRIAKKYNGRPPDTSTAACPANARKANLNFTLNNVDGKAVRLADYSGKVLLLDFWATWCGPCKVEIPFFIDLYEKYKSRGFEVAGVIVLDEFKHAAPFAREFKMNYTILDADGREDIDNAYGPMFALPTTYIIARDGRICAKHIGITGKDVFETTIKSLL